MRSDVIAVSSRQDATDLVLAETERVAAYEGLSHKGALHLRLLAEEMMSMVRAIAGEVRGEFWVENQGQDYQLHLRVKTDMDMDKREQLLSVSSSGKNEAERGLMGKIRAFFEPLDDVPPAFFEMNAYGVYNDLMWSMRSYEMQLAQYVTQERTGAREAWDELEKSVIAHVADEVKVSIRGREVEMTIFKAMA